MPVRVGFIGAPDSGKTTLAQMVSAKINSDGNIVTYVDEYARHFIGAHGVPTLLHQYYILRKQFDSDYLAFKRHRRLEESLGILNSVVVTDSPLLLNYVYSSRVANSNTGDVLDILSDILKISLSLNYRLLFYLKPFRRPINDLIRTKDLGEIEQLDFQIKSFMDMHSINYVVVEQETTEKRFGFVMDMIYNCIPGLNHSSELN